MESGKPVKKAIEVSCAKYENGKAVYNLVSGSYVLWWGDKYHDRIL